MPYLSMRNINPNLSGMCDWGYHILCMIKSCKCICHINTYTNTSNNFTIPFKFSNKTYNKIRTNYD
jgi:hypothetical protein